MENDSKENAEEMTPDRPFEERGTPSGPDTSNIFAGYSGIETVPSVAPPGAPSPAEIAAARARAKADRLAAEAIALEAALRGEPGTLPITWCKKCQAEVKPEGKGQCPRCGAFLRLNFVPRKHPINKLRKQQLLDKLVADYRPSTTLAHSSCEMLAGILEQLEVLKPGGPDHQRLVQLSQLLGAALDATRPTHLPTDLATLSPDQLVAKAKQLLELAELAARAPDFERAPCRPEDVDGGVVPEPAHAVSEPPTAPPDPAPICQYCHQPLARCEQIKTTRLDAWRALHLSDPAEIERREKQATDEMFESLRRQRTGGDPYIR